jgi:aminopeptidase N
VGGQSHRSVEIAAVEYLTTPMGQSSQSTHGAASAGDPYLPTSGNGGYRVTHYDLDLGYRVGTNQLRAVATISAVATMDIDRFSLDFAGLSAEKVTIDGHRPRKVSQAARKLIIAPADVIAEGAEFEIVVRYGGAPHPVRSPWGELGWEELADGVIVASQPSGAASWFPCNDHPGNKATFRIAVACESPYTVVANGNLVEKSTRSGRTTWVFDVPQPMATYLATLQIGRYTRRTTPAQALLFYPPELAREVAVDFARLDEMIALFIDLFGDYPFDSYSVVVTPDVLEIPLEAQGLGIFGRNHVDGAHGSDRLIAHELAHQWFGNSLTLGRWRDIWLHEGFACYAEWLWSEASGGRTAHENAVVHRSRVKAVPKDSLVVGDPGAHSLFDDRVYKRGALALHAIRLAVGDDAFFGALRSWVAENRHGTVTSGGFVEAFTQHTGSEAVAAIVDRWIYAAAVPSLE